MGSKQAEAVCNCGSYGFPHRLGGGRCRQEQPVRFRTLGVNDVLVIFLRAAIDASQQPGDGKCRT